MNSFNIKECYTLLVEFLCFYYYDLIKICFWSVNKCHTMHLIYAFNTILKAKIRKYTCRVQVKQTNPFVLSQYCYNFIIFYVAIQADAVFENILYVNTKCTLEYVCTYLAKLTALLIFLTTSKRSDVNNRQSFIFSDSIFSFEVLPVQVLNLKFESLLTTHSKTYMQPFCWCQIDKVSTSLHYTVWRCVQFLSSTYYLHCQHFSLISLFISSVSSSKNKSYCLPDLINVVFHMRKLPTLIFKSWNNSMNPCE